MPANVERMFSVREGTWHGLEDRLDDYPSMEDVKAYFGYEVERRPIFMDTDPDNPDAELLGLPGWDALVRTDTGAFLTPARESYGIVQPAVLVDLTEAVVAGSNKEWPVRITTGGILDEGRRIWTLAEVQREWFVNGDTSPIMPFVLLANSFDQTLSLMARTTGVRVVCQNTLDLAVAQKGGASFSFKHTSQVMDRVDEARAILQGAETAMDAFVEMSNELVTAKVSKDGVKHFLAAFIPEPPKLKQTDRKMASIEEGRNAVLSILSGATGTVVSRHSGTAYGLYTAGIEYLDFHRKSQSAESLFSRTMLEGEKVKKELLTLVQAAAKVDA